MLVFIKVKRINLNNIEKLDINPETPEIWIHIDIINIKIYVIKNIHIMRIEPMEDDIEVEE